MHIQEVAALAKALEENVSKVIIGKSHEIRLVLTAVLCGGSQSGTGHVLLEDVPGTGKTTLAKALAKSLDCAFARVQFTPDLLPADVTGMRVYSQQSGEFTFIKGPAFTNILLADEINRATPRTQSALLECMEEKQITEGGVTYPLAEPFLVIATQNPIETQGTFPLPEAQLDRFLMCLSLGYPQGDEAVALMQRFIAAQPLKELSAVAKAGDVTEAAAACRTVRVDEDVMRYMAALVEAARDREKVRLGPSPRALLALMRACQAWAAIHGRGYVIPDDVKALAVPVLAHRIVLRGVNYQTSPEVFVTELLSRVEAPTEKVQ